LFIIHTPIETVRPKEGQMSTLARHALARRALARRALASAAIAAVALLGAVGAPARAAVPDACGLITEHELAKSFNLARSIKHTTVVTQPGNAAGVLRQTCRAFAWRGPKPTNAKRRRTALLEGALAQLTIHTWVPDDEGPNAHSWRMRFLSAVKAQRAAAVDVFLRRLHGTRLIPPRSGADHSVAFQALAGRLHRARGLWWNQNDKTLISIEVTQAKSRPVLGPLEGIAAHIVPGFSS
jgi:hypothetical protein